jgi:AcrR family transcriptional regulator
MTMSLRGGTRPDGRLHDMALAEEEPSDRRELILDAAVTVISRRGVDRARLADVAEQAGVSLGLVQHYFRTRERLLVETFRREQERISAIWSRAAPPGTDPLLRLAEYVRLGSPEGGEAAATPFDPGWSFWLEFWSKANRDDEIRAEVTDIYAEFGALFREAIQEGAQGGAFTLASPVEDVADRLISLMDGIAIRTLLGGLERERMLRLLTASLSIELGLDTIQRRRLRGYVSRRAHR